MQWLIDGGVPFDKDENSTEGQPKYHLTREGGHSHRRILHAADATGMAMQTSLQDNVNNHPNIEIFERHNALDLITEDKIGGSKDKVIGAYIWNRNQEHVETVRAKFMPNSILKQSAKFLPLLCLSCSLTKAQLNGQPCANDFCARCSHLSSVVRFKM